MEFSCLKPDRGDRMASILIVDDEEMVLDVTAQLAETLGMQARTAATGYEALALLATGGVDLVLTDIRMPDMGGLELALRIRSEHPGLPVLAHTADLPESGRVLFDDVIYKPASVKTLERTLGHHLRARSAIGA